MIAVSNYYPSVIALKIAKRAGGGVKVIEIPEHVGSVPEVEDYFSFMTYLIKQFTHAYGV